MAVCKPRCRRFAELQHSPRNREIPVRRNDVDAVRFDRRAVLGLADGHTGRLAQ